MSASQSWNEQVVAEFRANGGRVGGELDGAPLLLLHHRGRRTGREHVTPLMYQAAGPPGRWYVFASAAGAPTDPQWYHNLVAAGSAAVELGSEQFPVRVSELTGAQRDRVYAEQVARFPGFGEFEQKTLGLRVIPVLALERIGD